MQIPIDLGMERLVVEFAVVEDRQDAASAVFVASSGQRACLDAADKKLLLEAEPDKEKTCLGEQAEEMQVASFVDKQADWQTVMGAVVAPLADYIVHHYKAAV